MSHNHRLAVSKAKYLIFDADDTLWENNIYFESAFTQFCEFLQHSSLTPTQVRSILDEIEIANIKLHGYGSRNFARSLDQCYRHLAERDIDGRDLETVRQFATAILEHPMELLPNVEDTVRKLSKRYDLTVFTKGDGEEQRLKLDRSGLTPYFTHTAIVREKHETAYRQLVADCGLDPALTWMIGNSPRSDINPALAAGLHAVFVPHPRTWNLEHERLPEGHPRLQQISDVRELLELFPTGE